MLCRSLVAVASLVAASSAAAWTPGSELVGQEIQVQTNGVVNTIQFEPNGIAHIRSPSGAKVVDATWTTDQNQLCLRNGQAFDCYEYKAPIDVTRPVSLKSVCGVNSQWTALPALRPSERG
jgi:hypothetical protein